jgi:uncharacterized membrane protein (DUF485 family)
MKKVGFRRRISVNVDWSDPFMVFFIMFTAIGVLIAIILTALSAWKEGWVASAVFGGVGILFGIIGLICALVDS